LPKEKIARFRIENRQFSSGNKRVSGWKRNSERAMTHPFTGLVIAGTHSGCGKTLAALALAAALRSRSLRVQGFKVGPDFIDPSHMTAITGRTTHNLDGWMLSRTAALELFQRHGTDVDFCLVEGVMGLFDGASGTDETGSTAEMAKWLGLPVILVLDARSQGRSAAALVRGFRDFDPGVNLAGVLFTKVGGPGHVQMLREAMAAHLPDLPCLGVLPRRPDLTLPSRHLGLHMGPDVGWDAPRRARLSAWIEQDADVPGMLRLAEGGSGPRGWPVEAAILSSGPDWAAPGAVRLGVARDRAFCFYYEENLDLLCRCGADLAFFSPLRDGYLPGGIGGLYLGGGYPELFAAELAANESMRFAVRRAAQAGMPVYAECGGFLYLLAALEDAQGATHPMAGVFPHHAKMHSRFQALGYREATLAADCLLGAKGETLRGHEFHYSGLSALPEDGLQAAYLARDRRGREFAEGVLRGNVLASYIHLHFGSRPRAASSLIAACALWAKTASTFC
jgi:cobyrinic acid a,c-diamide synthase